MSHRILVGCDWCGVEVDSSYEGRPNQAHISQVDGEDLCGSCKAARLDALRSVRASRLPGGKGPCPHMPSRLTPCLECERTGARA